MKGGCGVELWNIIIGCCLCFVCGFSAVDYDMYHLVASCWLYNDSNVLMLCCVLKV